MAFIQYNSAGLAAAGLRASSFPEGIANTLQSLRTLVLTTSTPTVAAGTDTFFGKPITDTFYGTGFTYDGSGHLVGGTITAFMRAYNNQTLSDLTQIAIPVTQLNTWISATNALAAENAIYGGNDVIIGTTGDDNLDGYGGDDIFSPGAGNDVILGNAGTDTVILSDFVWNAHITGLPTSAGANVTGFHFTDVIGEVERLQFLDGTKYYDIGSNAAQVYRMYDTALGRAPDAPGLAAWTSAMRNGMSINQLAANFISSAEFQARYPGINQNPTALVTQLYQNALHRAPDADGLAYWVNGLTAGSFTSNQVVVNFSESAEHQTTLAANTSGLWVPDETYASVARLYYTTLNRAPDFAGLIYWGTALQNGSSSLLDEAQSFMGSPEFGSKYGNLSNADFVTLIYNNVLGRAPDGEGGGFWMNHLNTDMTRAQVVVGFSESAEHVSLMAGVIDNTGIVLTAHP